MTFKLTLKWGTIKGFSGLPEKAQHLVEEYDEIGSSSSAMAQADTTRQKQIICELIDMADLIKNDWSGEIMTREGAKTYIMEYDA